MVVKGDIVVVVPSGESAIVVSADLRHPNAVVLPASSLFDTANTESLLCVIVPVSKLEFVQHTKDGLSLYGYADILRGHMKEQAPAVKEE